MNRKGFTLVEIMLVIAITAILLLIIVPNAFILIEKNKEKSCNNLINNIESAAKIYVTNNKYNMGFGCDISNNTKEIAFQRLVGSGDLKLDSSGQMLNPVTGKEISLDTKVTVTYDCTTKQFTYYVNSINCDKNAEPEQEQIFALNIISKGAGRVTINNITKQTSTVASNGSTTVIEASNGDTIKISSVPSEGYTLTSLKKSGTSLNNNTTFIATSAETIEAVFADVEKPSANIESLSEKIITLKYSDSNGVTGYYFGTTNPSNNTVPYTSISKSKNGSLNTDINNTGIYYFAVKDAVGNTKIVNKEVYSINYNANSGTNAPTSQLKLYGQDLLLSSSIPKRDGYTFVGWNTSQITNSTTSYTYEAGKKYSSNNSTTLYAVWYCNTQAVYSSTDSSLRFYNTTDIIREGTTYNGRAVTKAYVDFHNRNYDEDKNTSPTLWKNVRENINYVKVEQSIYPKDTSYWFKDFINTSKFDLEKLDTSNTTLMYKMFMNAGKNITGSVSLNLDSWDTSKVSNMGYMFHYAGYNSTDLSINGITNWNTSKVEHMKHMFSYTGFKDAGFSLGLTNWNTLNVKNMDQMFNQTGRNSTIFTLGDISKWDTSNVTDMYYMFQYAGEKSNWTLDLRNWDVSKVTRYEGFNTGVTSKVIAPNWK